MTSNVTTSQTSTNVNMSINNTNFGSSQVPGTRSYDVLLERQVGSGWDVIGRRINVGSPHVGTPFHVHFTNIGQMNANMRIRIHSYYGTSSGNTVYRGAYITSHTTPLFLR